MIDETDYSDYTVPTHLGMYRKKSKRKYFPREANPHGSKEYYNRVMSCISDGFYKAFGDNNISFDNENKGRLGTSINFELE